MSSNVWDKISKVEVVRSEIKLLLFLNTVLQIIRIEVLDFLPLFMFFHQLFTQWLWHYSQAVIFQFVNYLASKNFCLMLQLIHSPRLKTLNVNLDIVKPFDFDVICQSLLLFNVVLYFGLSLGMEPLGRHVWEELNIIFVEIHGPVCSLRLFYVHFVDFLIDIILKLGW